MDIVILNVLYIYAFFEIYIFAIFEQFILVSIVFSNGTINYGFHLTSFKYCIL